MDLSKAQQSSDWGAAQLQRRPGGLRRLRRASTCTPCAPRLDEMLVREGRDHLARACFEFLPHRALLDVAGWEDIDIFAHA